MRTIAAKLLELGRSATIVPEPHSGDSWVSPTGETVTVETVMVDGEEGVVGVLLDAHLLIVRRWDNTEGEYHPLMWAGYVP